MKKTIALTFLMFSVLMLNAADFVYCDFETKDLHFATNNALTYVVIGNPVSSGINTSANVGKVVSAGEQWELIYSASMPEFIDFDESKVFKMKVYSPRAGVPVYFKVEGGGPPKEVTTVTTTKVDEWEELVFDFTGMDVPSKVYNKFVLLFDAGQTGSGETFYFDDIIGPNTITVTIPETTFVPYCDFEDVPLNFVQANTDGNMEYDVVSNPDKSGINTSDSCAKIVTTADSWELLISDTVAVPFNFEEYGYKFKMMVLAPEVGDVYFKVENKEGNTNKEAQLYCPVANAWHELEFDFSELLPASNVMSKIILLFDANSTAEGNVWYFDNILGPGDDGSTGTNVFTRKHALESKLSYPNPVNDQIHFYQALENSTVKIVNLTGAELFSEKLSGNQLEISNLGLASGMYILSVDDNSELFLKQ